MYCKKDNTIYTLHEGSIPTCYDINVLLFYHKKTIVSLTCNHNCLETKIFVNLDIKVLSCRLVLLNERNASIVLHKQNIFVNNNVHVLYVAK